MAKLKEHSAKPQRKGQRDEVRLKAVGSRV